MIGSKRQPAVEVDKLEANTRKEEIRRFFTLRHEKQEKFQPAFGAIKIRKMEKPLLEGKSKGFLTKKECLMAIYNCRRPALSWRHSG